MNELKRAFDTIGIAYTQGQEHRRFGDRISDTVITIDEGEGYEGLEGSFYFQEGEFLGHIIA